MEKSDDSSLRKKKNSERKKALNEWIVTFEPSQCICNFPARIG